MKNSLLIQISIVSQLIDKDFNNILSDHQLPVSTLAAPNRLNETQLHPTFADQKTDSEVKLAKASAVPKNTARTTTWCIILWNEQRKNRKKYLCNDYPPPPQLCTVDSLNSWLCRFILKARRKDGSPYPPRTLYLMDFRGLESPQVLCRTKSGVHNCVGGKTSYDVFPPTQLCAPDCSALLVLTATGAN